MTLEIYKQERPDKITMWDRIAQVMTEAEIQQKTQEQTDFYNLDQQMQQTEDDSSWPQAHDDVEQRWANNKADWETGYVTGAEEEMGDDTCYPDNDANDDTTQQALDK